MRSHPGDQNAESAHDEHHRRHHEGHDAVREELCAHQIGVGVVKTLLLCLLPSECSDHHQSGQDLSGNQIQPVHQLLHALELRHRQHDKREDDAHNHCDPQQNHPAHVGVGLIDLHDSPDCQHRRIEHHPEHHRCDHLDLLDIIGRPGDQGGGLKMIHLCVRVPDDIPENLQAKVSPDTSANPGRDK